MTDKREIPVIEWFWFWIMPLKSVNYTFLWKKKSLQTKFREEINFQPQFMAIPNNPKPENIFLRQNLDQGIKI